MFLKLFHVGNSLVVQWLGLHAFTAKGEGAIPGRGTKILQTTQGGQKKKIIPCLHFFPRVDN